MIVIISNQKNKWQLGRIMKMKMINLCALNLVLVSSSNCPFVMFAYLKRIFIFSWHTFNYEAKKTSHDNAKELWWQFSISNISKEQIQKSQIEIRTHCICDLNPAKSNAGEGYISSFCQALIVFVWHHCRSTDDR